MTTDKHKSIFKELKEAVAKLPQWVSAHVHVTKKKKPVYQFEQKVTDDSLNTVNDLGWDEFEKMIHAIFQQRGYSIAEMQADTDDAIDIILKMDHEPTFVQCKHWKDPFVEVAAVSALYDVVKKQGARHGIVITSGEYTSEALDFALGKRLLLINKYDLAQMIDSLKQSDKTEENKAEVAIEPPQNNMPELEPLCPICGMKMIKRTAKKGRNAGNVFWGCSQYPRCRGVTSL